MLVIASCFTPLTPLIAAGFSWAVANAEMTM
jgi:hypothetical protein